VKDFLSAFAKMDDSDDLDLLRKKALESRKKVPLYGIPFALLIVYVFVVCILTDYVTCSEVCMHCTYLN